MSWLRGRYGILALVTAAQAGASLVQQGIGALGPALTSAFALTHAQLGVVSGAIMGGACVATAAGGVLVDTYGERRIILFSGCFMGLTLAAAAAFVNYWWLVGCMVLSGVAYGACTPAGGRAILLWFTSDRGLAMGIRQMGVPLGGFFGALMLPAVASAGGYRAALVAGGIVTALPSIATAIWYREPEGGAAIKRSIAVVLGAMGAVARDKRLIYVTLTGMVLAAAQSNMLTFLALTLVRDARFDVTLAAGALALAQVGASGGRIVWGFASDGYFAGDRTVPLVLCCLGAAVCLLALAFIPPHAVAAGLIVSFALGVSAAGWNGLHSAAQVEIGGVERAGSALGIALTGIFAMGMIAPPVFGAVVDARGFPFAWTALAATMLLGLIPAFFARRSMLCDSI